MFLSAAIAAAVPAACPATAQLFITRRHENAKCDALILRPAIIKFEKSFEIKMERGILNGGVSLCGIAGGVLVS